MRGCTLLAAVVLCTCRDSSALHLRMTSTQAPPTTRNAAPIPWSPSSWKSFPIKQPPNYPDEAAVEEVVSKLEKCSPLVFAGEVRTLQEDLARASLGQGFLLMGGDCAEAFNEFSVNHVRDTFRVMLQMALVMTFGGAMPVIKVGRMAGQFAKPRSEPDEVVNGVALPSYRGDIINGEEFTKDARTHNPQRMLDAYHQSSQTLNILRAFSMGGYADISRLHAWNLDFVETLPAGSQYRAMCDKVDESLRFMKAIGVDTRSPTFTQCNFYTAHECLLLPYEQALTRQDSITNRCDARSHTSLLPLLSPPLPSSPSLSLCLPLRHPMCLLAYQLLFPSPTPASPPVLPRGPLRFYDCSSHMLWVGERTRQLDHAHVHFVGGLGNPIGASIRST